LGEYKEGKAPKNVSLKLKIDGKDFVIGSLGGEERSQLMFDLVFEKEFQLSHGWKNGSVYFLGYVADDQVSDDEFSDMPEDDISEDELVPALENGAAKPEAVPAAKKAAAPVKEDKPAEDEDDSDSEDDEDDDDSDEDDLMESSEEEELPEPVPAKKNAKRPAESPKNAAPAKKNKSEQKGGSPFAGKNSGGKPQQGSNKKPQGGNNKSPQGGNKSNGQKQGGNKFSGQKGKAGGSNRK
jgi:nucleophosmin 1